MKFIRYLRLQHPSIPVCLIGRHIPDCVRHKYQMVYISYVRAFDLLIAFNKYDKKCSKRIHLA